MSRAVANPPAQLCRLVAGSSRREKLSSITRRQVLHGTPPSPNSKHAACWAKMALLLDQDKTSIALVCGWFEGQNVYFEESGTGDACRELTKWRDTGHTTGNLLETELATKSAIPGSRAVSTAKHRSAVLVSHSNLLYDTVLFPAICTLNLAYLAHTDAVIIHPEFRVTTIHLPDSRPN